MELTLEYKNETFSLWIFDTGALSWSLHLKDNIRAKWLIRPLPCQNGCAALFILLTVDFFTWICLTCSSWTWFNPVSLQFCVTMSNYASTSPKVWIQSSVTQNHKNVFVLLSTSCCISVVDRNTTSLTMLWKCLLLFGCLM